MLESFTLVIGNYNYSSWSLRAWLTLRKSGAPFDVVRLPMDTPEFHERVRQYSPTGRVPVLLADNLTVWDSLAISEYLAERYPQACLWPESEGNRAVARSIAAEMHSGLGALREEFPMNCRGRDRKVQASDRAAGDLDRVEQWLRTCRNLVSGNGPVFGHYTITDSMLIPVLLRFNTYGLAKTRLSKEYLDWVLSDEDVIDWMKHAEKEVEIIEHEER
jgi:glutathione S-transferase